MKVLSEKEVTVTVKESVKNWTLNLTDIIKNSNKFYNIEVIKSDKDEFYLYTNYGRVGGTSAKEYRLCSSQADAEMEAFKIIKSKMKKGYNEVKLVKTDVGSELGKAKIQTSKISTDDFAKLGIVPTKVEPTTSSLHPQVQDLVRGWFGITKEFLELNLDTKKCPLGQLSLEQIVKGKNILEEAKTILKLKQPPIDELNSLTNKYYSNIPHNFGYRKIDANNLRFDSNQKIDSAISLLEIFENTKDFAAQLTTKSPIDDQYKTLNSDIGFIDPSSEEFSTIEKLISYTRATNHSFLGKIKLNRAFSLRRNNEDKLFISLVDEIAKKSNGRVIPSLLQKFWNERKAQTDDLEKMFEKANVLPLFHGTRTPNILSVISRGLLVKHDKIGSSGSMYGANALYFGFSSKSLNYTSAKGSYWASGADKYGYMFLSDVALGTPKVATGSSNYSWNSIQPHHSVWAKGGYSGVINDEFMTYRTGQNHLKYILEIECKA